MRNESAEDFLELLKEWEKLCKRYNTTVAERKLPCRSNSGAKKKEVDDISATEFEVSKLVDICFGDPNETGNRGLYFKVINPMSTFGYSVFVSLNFIFMKSCLYVFAYLLLDSDIHVTLNLILAILSNLIV